MGMSPHRIKEYQRIIIEDYRKKLRVLGGRKVTNELSSMMNYAVSYGDKQTIWRSVLLLKTRELSHYLTEKTKKLSM